MRGCALTHRKPHRPSHHPLSRSECSCPAKYSYSICMLAHTEASRVSATRTRAEAMPVPRAARSTTRSPH